MVYKRMILSKFNKYKEYICNFVAKEYDQAEDALQICINTAKNENDINNFIFLTQSMGDLYFLKGDTEKASSIYSECEKIDNSSWTKYRFAKFLFNRLRHYEQAIAKAEEVIKTALKSPWPETEDEFSSDYYLAQCFALQGYCYSRLGDYENASKKFRDFTNTGLMVQDYDVDLCDALISNDYCITEARNYLNSVLTKLLESGSSEPDERYITRIKRLIN